MKKRAWWDGIQALTLCEEPHSCSLTMGQWKGSKLGPSCTELLLWITDGELGWLLLESQFFQAFFKFYFSDFISPFTVYIHIIVTFFPLKIWLPKQGGAHYMHVRAQLRNSLIKAVILYFSVHLHLPGSSNLNWMWIGINVARGVGFLHYSLQKSTAPKRTLIWICFFKSCGWGYYYLIAFKCSGSGYYPILAVPWCLFFFLHWQLKRCKGFG